jgi:putative exporter of polyketide antibiotics
MRARQHRFHDADDTVPASSALNAWHPTGDGVVFFDTAQRRRELDGKARSRKRHWAAIAVVLSIIALGTTTALALDWFSPDALTTLTTPQSGGRGV